MDRYSDTIEANVTLLFDETHSKTGNNTNPINPIEADSKRMAVFFYVNELLQNSKTCKTGQIFIVEHTGKMLASSEKDIFYTANKQNIMPSESKNAKIRSASKMLLKRYGKYGNIERKQTFSVRLSGEKHFIQIIPFHSHHGIDCLIVTVIPENEVTAGNDNTILCDLLVFVATVIIGCFFSWKISKPVLELIDAAQSITTGDYSREINIKKSSEIENLAEAFNSMSSRVRELIETSKQQTEKRKELENKFKVIFDYTFHMVGLTTVDGTLIDVNKTALELAGTREADVLGMPFWKTPWWKHSNEHQNAVHDAIKKAATGEFVCFETSLELRDGTLRYIEFSIRPIKDRNGEIVMLLPEGHDITEHKLSENKLRALLSELEEKNRELKIAYEELETSKKSLIHSEIMASLGLLSAGIAHELKNPLGIILQGVAYVSSSIKDYALFDACERITKSAIHADMIIRNLLSFARQTPLLLSETDLRELIEEALAIVEYQADRKSIKTIKDFARALPRVKVDGSQIKQVFINILVNAIDAINDGGSIVVSTSHEVKENKMPRVRITIIDNGTGIPEDILQKVYDPFFTTKENSGGTGLGLSITKGIVERHNGEITIKSKQGVGTIVTVSLPIN